MSHLDPFTQKLLLRTQARKEARLKKQVSSVESTSGSTLVVEKRIEPSTPPKKPLGERNEVSIESSPGRTYKKRQSSEKHNCSLEKRSKSEDEENICENAVSTPGLSSPLQRVTVKASIQESPKHPVKSSSLAVSLSELARQYSEHNIFGTTPWTCPSKEEESTGSRSSCKSSVSTSVLRYSMDFGGECEEEGSSPKYKPRRSFKENISELIEQYSEHLHLDNREEDRTSNEDSSTTCKSSKKCEVSKPLFSTTESSYKSPLNERKELKEAQNGTSSEEEGRVRSGRTVREGVAGDEMEINGESTKVNRGSVKAYRPPVSQKPQKGSLKRNPATEEVVANTGNVHACSDEDEKGCSGAVKNVKSIFEERMKQEREARDKEREADEWLKTRGSRTSGTITNAVSKLIAASSDEKIDKLGNEPSVGKEKVKENHTGVTTQVRNDDQNIVMTDRSERIDTEIRKSTPNTISVDNKVSSVSKMAVDPPVASLPESTIDSPVKNSKNYTGDIHSPQPVDCTEDTIYSDTQVFDVSSMLAIAARREEAQCHLKAERGHPNRASTMKVEPFHLVAALPDLNMTPIRNDSEDEESLSEFAKALRKHGKSVKGANLKQKLEAVDPKFVPLENTPTNAVEMEQKTPTNAVEMVTKDAETPKYVTERIKDGSKSSKKRPDKPPRSNNKKSEKMETKHSNGDHVQHRDTPTGKVQHRDTPTGKAGLKTIKEKHLSTGCHEDDANVISKPVDATTRKKMRKSSSFSEGIGTTPVKSGYHREMSQRYNACASSDKPDIVFSKNIKIQSLLEEAASQQNIVLQASQALNVAECSNEDKSNSPEVIEGERLLLLATERRTICLEEVKSLKESDFDQCQYKDADSIPPCKATLGLTDLKLPLHQDFVYSLKTRKLDIGMFHFVVIISAGNKNVYCTKVVSCYDDMIECALVLKDSIVMKNIPHDFTLTIKVFGMHSGSRLSDQITKVKKNSTNTQSPGNLKNLFSKRSKEDDYSYHASPQTVFRTSNFKLVGETKINLNLLGNGLTKYVLTKVPTKCPLEGCIQMRANCKPEFSANVTGFLTILEDVGGYTAWNRRWCSMKDSRILYWRYPDDEKDKDPMGSVDLRYCSDKMVKLLSRDICARPHTFELNLKRSSLPSDSENLVTTIEGKVTKIKYWVCCDNKEDRLTWMDTINKQLSDSRAWRLKKITLKSPTSPTTTTTIHQV